MANRKPSFWSTPAGWAALGLIGAVSYFLLVEHGEHLYQWLPYIILLLCPLMHLFMHGSHGHHHSGEHQKNRQEQFKEDVQKNEAYLEGFLEGFEEAKKGTTSKKDKENNNA